MLKNIRAFTLVEVLVALMIIAMTVLSLITSQGIALKSTRKARIITKATLAAKKLMTEIEVNYDLQGFNYIESLAKKEEKEFEEKIYKGWKWEREIKEVEFPITKMLNFYMNIGKKMSGEASQEESYEPNSSDLGMFKIITDSIETIMKQSVREITVKVYWPIKGGRDYSSLQLVYFVVDNDKVASFVPGV
jgi:prepilin-type N-terminal cleavage/methylation domain-containing protein